METARLRLRPWTADDLDPLVALFALPEVWRFPFGRGLDPRITASFLHRQLRAQEAGEPAVWAAEPRDDPRLIGYIGLSVPHWLPAVMPAVEVGWRLHPNQWGRGLATEGGAAALAHGFDVLGLDRILAMCQPENVASVRVAEKLGMRHVEDVLIPDLDVVTGVYALHGPEWGQVADFPHAE